MKRLGIVLLYAVGGYFVWAVVGYLLVDLFSSKMHDRSVEAAMTSAFVLGPLGAGVAAVVGFIRSGRGALRPGAAG